MQSWKTCVDFQALGQYLFISKKGLAQPAYSLEFMEIMFHGLCMVWNLNKYKSRGVCGLSVCYKHILSLSKYIWKQLRMFNKLSIKSSLLKAHNISPLESTVNYRQKCLHLHEYGWAHLIFNIRLWRVRTVVAVYSRHPCCILCDTNLCCTLSDPNPVLEMFKNTLLCYREGEACLSRNCFHEQPVSRTWINLVSSFKELSMICTDTLVDSFATLWSWNVKLKQMFKKHQRMVQAIGVSKTWKTPLIYNSQNMLTKSYLGATIFEMTCTSWHWIAKCNTAELMKLKTFLNLLPNACENSKVQKT